MNKARKLFRHNAIARYIFVGGVSYIIEILSIYLIIALGVHQLIAVGVSFWVGLIVSFLLQKVVTFKNTDRDKKSITKQSVYYAALVLFNYVFTLFAVQLFSSLLGNVFIARTIALIITTSWNYFIYKNLIFKDKQ